METEDGADATRRPSPAEAGAALRDAEHAAGSLEPQPPPWWYFLVIAALIAVAPVARFAPLTVWGVIALFGGLIVWLLLFGLTLGLYIKQIGFVPRVQNAPKAAVWPPLVVAVVMLAAGAVLASAYDQDWIWFAASGTLAVLLLGAGAAIRRQARATA